MISDKSAVTLFFIILGIQLVASTSTSNDPKTTPPSKLILLKRRGPIFKSGKTIPVLRDTDAQVVDVQPTKDVMEMDISQDQLVGQGKKSSGFFKTLMDRKQYKRILYFARRIGVDKFLERIYPLVKTLEQYNGIVDYLKHHRMVPNFYVHGDIDVVKEAIIAESGVYDNEDYVKGGNLETALSLAFKEGHHDRVIDLLGTRQTLTAEKDVGLEHACFKKFIDQFFEVLAPWKDDRPFRGFLVFGGEELKRRHPDIYEIFCEGLVCCLGENPKNPNARALLLDLMAQPSLLTPVMFIKGSLRKTCNFGPFVLFIWKWAEALQEGLKVEKYFGASRHLWHATTLFFPKLLPEVHSPSAQELATILKVFPTKQKLEEHWIEKNSPDFLKMAEAFLTNVFPTVLVRIILGYADLKPTLLDV